MPAAQQLSPVIAMSYLVGLLYGHERSTADLLSAQHEQRIQLAQHVSQLSGPEGAKVLAPALDNIGRSFMRLRFCAMVAGLVPPQSALAVQAADHYRALLSQHINGGAARYMTKYLDEFAAHPVIATTTADMFMRADARDPQLQRAASYLRMSAAG